MSRQIKKIHSISVKASKRRPTIGFFTLEISNEYAQWPWLGIVDAAKENDVNLVTFVGGILASVGFQANVVYDLAKEGRLDGLIIWKSGLVVMLDEAETEGFCRQFGIPVVTLEGSVSGCACVSYENYLGMRSAVDHLIDAHGYGKIGFVGMYEHHAGFRERYRAYADTMAAHGLPVDPRLARPWFPADMIAAGVLNDDEVLTAYLDEAVGLGMEAVVGITDEIALQLQEKLQDRGIRVPDDVAVVGFDDWGESRVRTPPLTTVSPSWYELGRLAAETLVHILQGKPVPEMASVPARLMVRQSCGCPDPFVAALSSSVHRRPDRGSEVFHGEIESLSSRLSEDAGSGAFLRALDDALQRSAASMEELTPWYDALSMLRQRVRSPSAEALLQQAYVLVGRASERTQMLKGFRAQREENRFHEVGLSLISTLDVGALMDKITGALSGLGIPACYMSLYQDPKPYRYPDPAPEWARLILACGPGGRESIESGGRRFSSKRMVPDEFWPEDRAAGFLLLPLYFQVEQLGFVLFETGSRSGRIYETLRTQISSALQGALLMQRVRDRSAELARQQYILDTFIATIPDLIYFKDFDSRITRANKAHALWMGFSDPSEEIGKSDFDFFSDEQAGIRYEKEQEILKTGRPIINSEEIDDNGHWLLATKMPLRDERGAIVGTFGISRDITELKRVQAALERAYAEVERQVQERTAQLHHEIVERRQAEEEIQRLNAVLEQRVIERTAELEAAVKEMEAFSYSISHDLRAPLRAINGFAQILLGDHSAQLPPEMTRYLKTISESSRHMSRLIDDLLAFSRSGRQPLNKQDIAMDDLVRQVLADLRPEHEGRTVEIVVDELPRCRADPMLLRQVWMNLLSNALKYTRRRSSARIRIGCEDQGGKAVYFVRDNGTGFDMRYADKLFGVFQRLHSAEEYEGTGVGLAIVQRIVQRHGGCVWAEAAVDAGATFYLTL